MTAPQINDPKQRFDQFDLYAFDPGYTDYQHYLLALREAGAPDVFWTQCNGGHWIATSSSVVKEVLRDASRFSSRCIVVPRERNPQPPMPPLQFDPPQSERYRNVFADLFLPKNLHAAEGAAREAARACIDSFISRGACEFVSQFATHMPMAVFFEMADIPKTDRNFLLNLAYGLINPTSANVYVECMGNLIGYIRTLAQRRSTGTGGDLISRIMSAGLGSNALPMDDLVNLVIVVFTAGLDTIVSTLAAFARFFAQNPLERGRLTLHPESMARTIEELLRLYPIFSPARVAIETTILCGVTIQADDIIVAPTAFVGLDESIFPDPTKVDVHRRKTAHAAFGVGAHRCTGASLARLEIRIFLEEWLHRIPDFSIDPKITIQLGAGPVATISQLGLRWSTD
jgi:cytochrome P450